MLRKIHFQSLKNYSGCSERDIIKANNNISGGGSSRYCFFSTLLPPTPLHLWRSCALNLVHPSLLWWSLWILPDVCRLLSDSRFLVRPAKLTVGSVSSDGKSLNSSTLFSQIAQTLGYFTESQRAERTVFLHTESVLFWAVLLDLEDFRNNAKCRTIIVSTSFEICCDWNKII